MISAASPHRTGATGEAPLQAATSNFATLELYNEVKSLVQVKIMEHEQEFNRITQAIQGGTTRLEFNVNFLNEIAPNFSKRLINEPCTFIPPFEDAVNDVARQLGQLKGDREKNSANNHIRVGFIGWLGSHSITPRGIRSDLANKVILVEGIVTRATPAASRLRMAAYYIPELGRHVFREYADKYELVGPNQQRPMNNAMLTSDADGRAVELEDGLSEYKDYQWLTLQEMPEITPLGQLPRSVEVLAEQDLVDKAKPGDRTRICGMLMTTTHCNGSTLSGGTSVCLVANSIQQLQINHMTRKIEPSKVRLFKELARDPNTLDLIAASIAPAISGHRRVRQGIALQLAGGVTQDAPNGLRRRGDIHLLLLGDPSCGKSQILRYALRLAPLAVSATGRGSSAVGLTAAITKDAKSGQQRLEAGAMVLADKGMVCIDEFDKMGHDDRSAVHEVMEQQKVTVFKANISAVLNARTSVLAAANPIYGNFNDNLDLAKQINFPDSLLSRFDLIFLIRESASAAQDRKIAQQVLSQLRAIKKDAFEDTRRQRAMRADVTVPTLLQPRSEIEAEGRANLPVKQLMWQHNTSEPIGRGKGKLSAEAIRSAKASRLLQPEFLKEFLIHCRFNLSPTISDEADEEIASFYGYLRDKIRREWASTGTKRATPTPRLLEALIRLSTAHAKLKMKNVVDLDDVQAAKSLVVYTLFAHDDQEEQLEPENEPPSEPHDSTETARPPKRTRERQRNTTTPLQALSEEIQDLSIEEPPKKKKAPAAPPPTAAIQEFEPIVPVLSSDMERISQVIDNLCETTGEEDWDLKHIFKQVKKVDKNMTNNAFTEIVKKMQTQNLVMVVGSRLYKV